MLCYWYLKICHASLTPLERQMVQQAVKSTWSFCRAPGLSSEHTHGGSKYSITLVPGIQVRLLTFSCTRDIGDRHKCMQTKYSYTKINLKKKLNICPQQNNHLFIPHFYSYTKKTEVTNTFKVGIKQKNQTSNVTFTSS